MIKKLAKGFGLVAGLAAGIGVYVYFDSLNIEGDPALKVCWAVDIIDDVTGEKVVGAEDLDFDPATGTIFLSAYDRRAVDRELMAGGPVTTQGGIYTLNVSDIHQTGVLPVHDISRKERDKGESGPYEGFRPHGIAFSILDEKPFLTFINRSINNQKFIKVLDPEKDTEPTWNATIDIYLVTPDGLLLDESLPAEGLCNPNDVTFRDKYLFATESTALCDWGNRNRGMTWSHEMKFDKYGHYYFREDYYNGIVDWGANGIAVADSFEDSIYLFEIEFSKVSFRNRPPRVEAERILETIDLSIAPDNLTLDSNRNLYVTGFPNLLDYYFYMSEWSGVEKSPSAAFRIAPETYEQTLLFKDDGTMISGATTALRAGDYLVLGSAWDDNIAICSGMDGID